MGWLSLLRALLSLINYVAEIIRDKQLLDAGEAVATAKSLAVLQSRLGIADQVAAEVDALSDGDVDAELRK